MLSLHHSSSHSIMVPFANGIMKNHSRKHHQTISDAIIYHEKRFNHLTALFVAHCIIRSFTVWGFLAGTNWTALEPNLRCRRIKKPTTGLVDSKKIPPMSQGVRNYPLSFWPNEVIWVFPKIGVSQNGWFIMEILIKWMTWD